MAKPDDEESHSRMSFGDHLEELRKRVLHALYGSTFGIVLCVIYYKVIIDIVVRPYTLVAQAHHLPGLLGANKPQEAFLTSITLAFQAGLVLSSPWIIYQLWKFVAAGLYEKERKVVYRYTAPSAFLFLAGVSFFYFLVLPMTLNFFVNFNVDTAPAHAPVPTALERILIGIKATATAPATSPSTGPATTTASQPAPPIPLSLPVFNEDPPIPPDGTAFAYYDARDNGVKIRIGETILLVMVAQQNSLFTTTWRYDDYLSFVTFTALIFGLAFELPMVMLILAQVGIVEVPSYRRVRKYAYFGILIISAIAAPSGDLMTLACLTVPLFGLYELGIIAAAIVVRRQKKALEN